MTSLGLNVLTLTIRVGGEGTDQYWGLALSGAVYMFYLPLKRLGGWDEIYLALFIRRFHICGFNPPQMENTMQYLQYAGPTDREGQLLYPQVLQDKLGGLSIWRDYGIHRDPGTNLP